MSSLYRTAAGEAAVRRMHLQFLECFPPTRQHRAKTRQGETFVAEFGLPDGPPVVLLHGKASNSAMWLSDIPVWSRNLRILAVDIIGDAGLSAPSRPAMQTDAAWLDDVLAQLSIDAAAVVGISLGGWIAIDYATRRPERVSALVVINPGGVGRPRNVLFWTLPLLMLGKWGRRKMMERIAGRPELHSSPELVATGEFTSLILEHFKPRKASQPQFDDDALDRLDMPVLAILGGKDVFIDAYGARQQLEAHVKRLTKRLLPDAPHFVHGQTSAIWAFLTSEPRTVASSVG